MKWVLLLTIISIWSVVYLCIDRPPNYYFDEPFYVEAADAYFSQSLNTDIETGVEINSEHPPLGKWIIGFLREHSADKILGSRLPSYIFGLIVLISLSLIAYEFLQKWSLALWPPFLASTDPIFLNLSKVAMLDMMCTGFFLSGLYLLLLYRKNKFFGWIILSGLLFGMSLAVKWNFLIVLFVALGFTLPVVRSYRQWALVLLIALGFYSILFLPHGDLWSSNVAMWNFHQNYIIQNVYSLPWWKWPFGLSSTTLSTQVVPEGMKVLSLIKNPFIHLVLFPLALLAFFFKKMTWQTCFLISLYGICLLQWSLVQRNTFLHYYLACLPFLYLLLVVQFRAILEKNYRWIFFFLPLLMLYYFRMAVTYEPFIPNYILSLFLF